MKPVLTRVAAPSKGQVMLGCRARSIAAVLLVSATLGGAVACFAILSMVVVLLIAALP
ncbi:hypothetical protein R3Q06_30930 [Rhodococcus erythropolis]|uniref:hypothetical protein n=1 Tax=Rhodococcus erythropolis TaxID=1833 RepID=UPI00294A7E83|nr:hypothetical protein [Rhodococcus erythropolis]MDV6277906.1 hypothetical protein [Rhodococcus erythropolis]